MPRQKIKVGNKKEVIVTDKSGKVKKHFTVSDKNYKNKTKVKGPHGKFKEKIKKDGTVKQVSWIDGKRNVEKFKRNSPDGSFGDISSRPSTPIPKADWKKLTPSYQIGGTTKERIVKADKQQELHKSNVFDDMYKDTTNIDYSLSKEDALKQANNAIAEKIRRQLEAKALQQKKRK